MCDSVEPSQLFEVCVCVCDSLEPTIDEFPEDTTAVEGEGVVFKVVVSGKPVPTITWFHDDTEISNNYSQEILDDGSLNLPSAEVKQTGVYRMVARNSVGSVEQQVKLTIQVDGEKTPDTDRRVMTFAPIPVAEFGEYVAQNHGNNNQGFRDQFNVSGNRESSVERVPRTPTGSLLSSQAMESPVDARVA